MEYRYVKGRHCWVLLGVWTCLGCCVMDETENGPRAAYKGTNEMVDSKFNIFILSTAPTPGFCWHANVIMILHQPSCAANSNNSEW
jgi:hypothetical protein